jgi:hypothetical protein
MAGLGFGGRNPNRLGSAYDPIAVLGGKVLGWHDSERLPTLNLSGNLVNTWTGIVAANVVAQGLTSAKPQYQATGFGGRPMVWGDGVDDFLALSPDPYASGANTEEFHILCDQQSPLSDALPRFIFAHGFGGSQGRRITRLASTYDLLGAVGDGAVIQTATIAGVFTGRCYVRMVVKATETDLWFNMGNKVTISVVPNTTATNLRFFASANATASSFWLGGLNSAMRTSLLSDSEAFGLGKFHMARLGL